MKIKLKGIVYDVFAISFLGDMVTVTYWDLTLPPPRLAHVCIDPGEFDELAFKEYQPKEAS